MRTDQLIVNYDYVPTALRMAETDFDIDEIINHVIEAGGAPPFTYAGYGMFGVVICDCRGLAYKHCRNDSNANIRVIEDEYEFLSACRVVLELRKHTARPRTRTETMLIRECVNGRPGSWSDDERLTLLHNKYYEMRNVTGWTAPEFKEDSYIIEDGSNRAVLVDASMAMRIGPTLIQYITDILSGRRPIRGQRWRDLAFDVWHELQHGLDREIGNIILKELYERCKDPDVLRWRKE